MRIFLTGATGFIGSAIARAARDAGHEVAALARTPQAVRTLSQQGLTPRPGNLLDPAPLAEYVQRADAVIHAGSTGGGDWPQVDDHAVRVMVSAMEGTNRPFIYTSGVWVIGDTGPDPATEHRPLRPPPVAAWRGPLEAWVRGAAGQGVRTVVIRPGIVYGDEGIPWMTATGAVPPVGDGDQWWPLVHRDDLAELYLATLERAPAGFVLHGVAHHRTARDVTTAIAPGAPVMDPEEARTALGGVVDALALHQRVCTRLTRSITGWRPRRPAPAVAELVGA